MHTVRVDQQPAALPARLVGGRSRAGLYRRSSRSYTEQRLLSSAFFYGLLSAFFLGVFLIKYWIEFLLSMRFLALLFACHLVTGMRVQSVAQSPEKRYREGPFVVYVGAFADHALRY